MADSDKQEIDWEAHDEARLLGAIQEISSSENLRYFIRAIFSLGGLHQTPFSSNALTMSKLAGRHELAMDVWRLLEAQDPALYPNLLVEGYNEELARKSTS